MATLVLPTPLFSEFGRDYRIDLDGVFYLFRYSWNARDDTYRLTLAENSGTETVRNLRLVVSDDILKPYKSLAVPQGSLNIVDTSGQGLDPVERVDFGDRVQIQYVEVET